MTIIDMLLYGGKPSYSKPVVSYPYVTNFMPSPFDPIGWTGASDIDGTITNVTTDNPSGEGFVGECTYLTDFFELNSTTGNRIPIATDEYVYLSILVRASPSDDDVKLFYRVDGVNGGSGQLKQDFLFTKSGVSSSDVLITELGDYRLIQIRCFISGTKSNIYGRFFIGTASPTNTVLYAQATFFGKSASLEYPYAYNSKFENTSDLDIWTTERANLSVINNDNLLFSPIGAPAGITTPMVIEGDKYSEVVIKWKRDGYVDGSNFFWWTNDNNQYFTPARVITFSMGGNNDSLEATTTGPDVDGFFTTLIDLSNHSEWNGQSGGSVKSIGVKFYVANSTPTEVDHIRVYSPALLEAYVETWPAVINNS